MLGQHLVVSREHQDKHSVNATNGGHKMLSGDTDCRQPRLTCGEDIEAALIRWRLLGQVKETKFADRAVPDGG